MLKLFTEEAHYHACLHALPWILALLAFLIIPFSTFPANIIGGLSLVTSVTLLILQHKHEEFVKAQKRKMPEIDAWLNVDRENKQWYVKIKSLNLIPFKAKWLVVTRDNVVISPVMMGMNDIYPSKDREIFRSPITLHTKKIVDGHFELRVDYLSMYAAELNDAKLGGRLCKPYDLERSNAPADVSTMPPGSREGKR